MTAGGIKEGDTFMLRGSKVKACKIRKVTDEKVTFYLLSYLQSMYFNCTVSLNTEVQILPE